MIWSRSAPPQPAESLRVVHGGQLSLDSQAGIAVLDGTTHAAILGCWMFYLPGLQAKLFHAADEKIDCLHRSRPDAKTLAQAGRPVGRYLTDDWRRALATPTTRRLAEIWLASIRLWQAGLGPQPLGVCFVDRLIRDARPFGPTCGILIQNVFKLPRKLNCKPDHVRQAGVVPDKILSCVRQQVRGYVVDLCSVVGCVPENAEAAVARLETVFQASPPAAQLIQALEQTFHRL